jgi:hypothetical protein
MSMTQSADLDRLNAQIVGHLLARRSPPRELLSQRDRLRATLAPRNVSPPQALRRFG